MNNDERLYFFPESFNHFTGTKTNGIPIGKLYCYIINAIGLFEISFASSKQMSIMAWQKDRACLESKWSQYCVQIEAVSNKSS